MNIRSLFSVAALAATFSASAQTWVADTITMGSTYAKDVYYHMGTGVVKEDSNKRWDLAFSAIPATAMTNPHYGVGAWINSAVSSTGTPVRLYSLHRKASTDFATISGTDTGTALTDALVNSEISYGIGAFNTNGNGTTGNYGWGLYNTTTHNIVGDSVYIAVKGSTAYKIWIEQYTAVPPTSWKFHVQKLDNSSPVQVVTLNITSDYANRVMAYYSFANGPLDREPASNTWDLNFTRYTAMVAMGPGPAQPYPVSGVFINPYIKVRRAWKATADTTNFRNYKDTAVLNVIGRDWKTNNFNSSMTAYILDTVNYFVKSNSGAYYQLEFTYASLSSLGKTAFRKRLINTTSVNTVNNTIANYYATPIPANNQVTLMVDTKERSSGAVVMLTDISGRTVYSQPVSVEQGMNTFSVNTASFPAGMYVLSLSGQNIKLAQKITVAH